MAVAVASLVLAVGCSTSGNDVSAGGRSAAVADGYVALCNDGNYSNNMDLTATCSGGDGIDEWLAEYGECEDGQIVQLREDGCGSNTDLARVMPADFEPPTAEERRVRAIADGYVALCNDGKHSNNMDLTATCSGGDGIDEWLAEYGECEDGQIVPLQEDACGYGTDLKRLMPDGYEPPPPPTTTTTTTTTTAPPPPPPTAPASTAPPTTAPPAPAPAPAPAPSASYANCTEARNAGAAPLYRGEPGYSSKLDRDGDGIACE